MRRLSAALFGTTLEDFVEFGKNEKKNKIGTIKFVKEDLTLIQTRTAKDGPAQFVMELILPSSEKLNIILNMFSHCIENKHHNTHENTLVVSIDFSKHTAHRTVAAMQALYTIVSPVKTLACEKYVQKTEIGFEKIFFQKVEEIFTVNSEKPFEVKKVAELEEIVKSILDEADSEKSNLCNDFYCLIGEKLLEMASQTLFLKLLNYAKIYFEKVQPNSIYFSHARLQLGKIALLNYSEDTQNLRGKHFEVMFPIDIQNLKAFQEITSAAVQAILKKYQATVAGDAFPEGLLIALRYFKQSSLIQAQYFIREFHKQCFELKNIQYSNNELSELEQIFAESDRKAFVERAVDAPLTPKAKTPPPRPERLNTADRKTLMERRNSDVGLQNPNLHKPPSQPQHRKSDADAGIPIAPPISSTYESPRRLAPKPPSGPSPEQQRKLSASPIATPAVIFTSAAPIAPPRLPVRPSTAVGSPVRRAPLPPPARKRSVPKT